MTFLNMCRMQLPISVLLERNVIAEKNKQVTSVEKLGFGKCRLSIAIPKTGTIKTVADLNGKKIATSYPLILSNYLKEKNINATIQEISGSVEIAPKIGLAEAICDLVSSGSTLFSNELTELETILRSEAVLISNKNYLLKNKTCLINYYSELKR
jgi:ATP phosphoribosyltransferase